MDELATVDAVGRTTMTTMMTGHRVVAHPVVETMTKMMTDSTAAEADLLVEMMMKKMIIVPAVNPAETEVRILIHLETVANIEISSHSPVCALRRFAPLECRSEVYSSDSLFPKFNCRNLGFCRAINLDQRTREATQTPNLTNKHDLFS